MHSVDYFKALADDTRLRCFRILALAGQELCVAECVDILRRPQYAVSRALVELRKAGLIGEKRRGKLVFYHLNAMPEIVALGAWVGSYCQCQNQPLGHNADGSGQPGAEACAYDSERLAWRLKTRDAQNHVTVTYGQQSHDQAEKPRVLFICVHNSARSQLAEAYLRQLAGEYFSVESAGLEPGQLNPYVVQILAEEGIDIAGKATQGVFDVYRAGKSYQWVITVCSRAVEENCPVFPGPVRRLSWPFADPSALTGSPAEILSQVRQIASAIKTQISAFVQEHCSQGVPNA